MRRTKFNKWIEFYYFVQTIYFENEGIELHYRTINFKNEESPNKSFEFHEIKNSLYYTL